MLFNSLKFALFFALIYSVYVFSTHKWQNRLLLLASYVFYGFWDYRFLVLIWLSTVLDYFCGIAISEAHDQRKRKLFLIFSVCGNLGILGFFKYFNFFAYNFQSLLASIGVPANLHTLHIILPVGISFYTFQTMSYTIDIYRKEMEPTNKFFDFALFVAFFPQLVAGPIERAKNLLPQILSKRVLRRETFFEGIYLIFWGLFLKVFVADNLGAQIVDPIFAGEAPYNGIKVLMGTYAFAFQIFCDFAGYSNIARGLSKCMGIDIMVNFNLPYFATNPSEFWKRWHISLSSWLKDYLYIPLGGNRVGKIMILRNLVLTMVLGGLWHGAGWTFIIWGAYQGSLLVIYKISNEMLSTCTAIKNKGLSTLQWFLKLALYFHLMCLGWLIFRAQSLGQLYHMFMSLFRNFHYQENIGIFNNIRSFMLFTGLLICIQIYQFKKDDLMVVYKLGILPKVVFYLICYFLIKIYGVRSAQEFIYFQF